MGALKFLYKDCYCCSRSSLYSKFGWMKLVPLDTSTNVKIKYQTFCLTKWRENVEAMFTPENRIADTEKHLALTDLLKPDI